MDKVRNRLRVVADRIQRWFSPLRSLGLCLFGFGVLVLLLPQILVILVASLLIFSGIALLSLGGRLPADRRETTSYFRPGRTYRMDPFWG